MQQADCNASATLMRAMNFSLRNIKDLMIYLDDILIVNHIYVWHIKTIWAVVNIAKDNTLLCNRNTYQFMPASMHILVNILTNPGLEADSENIDTIPQFPTAGNKRQLQRFLGKSNYFRQFCPQLRSVAGPLSELQEATKYCKWTHLHDVSLQNVKALIMSKEGLEPINPDPSQRIYLVSDSSHTGLAGSIGQKQDNGLVRPARFHRRKFSNLPMN